MTIGRRYLAGLLAAAAIGVVVVTLLPAAVRPAAALAVGLGFVVQAPLGWRLVRAFGGPSFLVVWGLGMGTRLVAVLLVAVVGTRMEFRSLEVLLISLVATLFGLLLVEAGALLKSEAE